MAPWSLLSPSTRCASPSWKPLAGISLNVGVRVLPSWWFGPVVGALADLSRRLSGTPRFGWKSPSVPYLVVSRGSVDSVAAGHPEKLVLVLSIGGLRGREEDREMVNNGPSEEDRIKKLVQMFFVVWPEELF